ncbi:MAG: hypothetical protein KY410_01835 [Proteobacteria bacterium]|nr:hypothetical protein [Pseudomonadota bacterium]
MGGVWKFSNSAAQTMPSLSAIPNAGWLTMAVIELLLGLCLVLPAFSKQLGILAIVAAILIAAEMLLFCGLHLRSGAPSYSPLIYWLVVAAVCAFIAYGRLVLKPF